MKQQDNLHRETTNFIMGGAYFTIYEHNFKMPAILGSICGHSYSNLATAHTITIGC